MLTWTHSSSGDVSCGDRPCWHRPHQGGRRVRRAAARRPCILDDLVRAQGPSPTCRTASAPTGPGPFGMFQTLADGIKLFFKEDLIPEQADRMVFKLAPFLSLVPAVPRRSRSSRSAATSTATSDGVVTICSGTTTFLQLADPPIGILLLLALARRSPSTASCSPAGPRARSTRCSARCGPRRRWSPTRRRSACRSSAVVLIAGSLSTNDDRRASRPALGSWNVVDRPVLVPFVIFIDRRRPPSSTARRSTSSRPSRSSSVASTPSTPRSASPCSSWPSS